MSTNHEKTSLLSFRYSRKLPLLVGLGIFSVHWVISFLLLKPSFHIWPCSDFLIIVLTAPGVILSIVLYVLLPAIENVIHLITPDQEAVMNFFAMTLSSCFYGLGGLLLFFDKKNVQALGVILIGLLIMTGCIAILMARIPCG